VVLLARSPGCEWCYLQCLEVHERAALDDIIDASWCPHHNMTPAFTEAGQVQGSTPAHATTQDRCPSHNLLAIHHTICWPSITQSAGHPSHNLLAIHHTICWPPITQSLASHNRCRHTFFWPSHNLLDITTLLTLMMVEQSTSQVLRFTTSFQTKYCP
jgi:hypothetical protein